jgi:hypothetical protein
LDGGAGARDQNIGELALENVDHTRGRGGHRDRETPGRLPPRTDCGRHPPVDPGPHGGVVRRPRLRRALVEGDQEIDLRLRALGKIDRVSKRPGGGGEVVPDGGLRGELSEGQEVGHDLPAVEGDRAEPGGTGQAHDPLCSVHADHATIGCNLADRRRSAGEVQELRGGLTWKGRAARKSIPRIACRSPFTRRYRTMIEEAPGSPVPNAVTMRVVPPARHTTDGIGR